ncbi:MAG: hypothetical protein RR614_02230 [Eubacterium sp.]
MNKLDRKGGKMLNYNNNKGSALVWVLVICIIFAILGMAIGAIALSMNNRSINNNLRQQTYFTARSAVDTIFEQLNGDPKKYPFSEYLQDHLLSNEKKVEIADMGFSEDMGDCSVEATYDVDKKLVTIKATAKKGGQEEVVVLTAKHTRSTSNNKWPNEKYAVSLVNDKDQVINPLGEDNFVYILDKDKETIGNGELIISDKSKYQAIFIYIKAGSTLTLKDFEGGASEPEVFIYIANGGTLAFNANKDGVTFPFYINGEPGSKVDIGNKKTITVYGESGVTVTDGGTLKVAEGKEIPQSGYPPIGKPGEGGESGIITDTWAKEIYTDGN